MGNGISRNRSGKRKGKKRNGNYDYGNRDVNIENQYREAEDVEMKWLRRTIRNEPEFFVLNNLMMCVQFFGNYEEDIARIRQALVSPREADINERLPPHKHVLLPDLLQEEVARNVGFTSSRQTLRPTIEPLQPVRIYIVHNNIEVTEEDSPNYYSIMKDTTTYNMLLKQTEHRGYVKLQLQEVTPLLKKVITEEGSNGSSRTKNDDGFYSDGDSVYGSKYARNADLAFVRQSKSSLRSSKYGHSHSSPNLYEEGALYEKGVQRSQENVYDSNNAHGSVKAESDYKADSLIERRSQAPELPARNGYPSRGGGYHRTSRHHHKSKVYSNNSRASSTSSGYRSGHYVLDSDSDCGCNHTCNVARSCDDLYSSADMAKNMEDLSFDEYPDGCTIPRQCFRKITYTSEGKIYDPLEERKYMMNSKQKRIRQILRRYNYDVSYVSSFQFMRYFLNIFVNQLAEILGFDLETIDDVKPEGGVIYCDKVMVSLTSRLTIVEPYEIIPTIWTQWPEDGKEWLDRPRSTWPSEKDIGKIQDFGCYVVPEGFSPKKGLNSFQDIEWQLSFPAAERYLETCMTPAQAHVLTTAHIRNRLFWMIEENDRPSKWPDHRMGECLVKLLQSLYYCISQNEPTLSDYFIRDRNLFQRVPSNDLVHTQKQIKRILENPIMYVFHAMENVRYSQQFFPKMNFEMLLNILTADTLTLINPALARQDHKPISKSSGDYYDTSKKSNHVYTHDRPGGFWENAKNISRTENEQKIYATKPAVTNKTLINPRKATDSVIEISERCADLEGTRLCALLDFFITHFMKMGERCHQYHALRQKTIYLDQAERLSILLSEYPRSKEDGKAYLDKIKCLRLRQDVPKVDNVQPQTSKRTTGEEPLFAVRLKNRYAEDESQPRLSIVTKEAMQFGIDDDTYDSASLNAVIPERTRAPTPSRTERAPAPSSRTTTPTPRVPSPTDKAANSTSRVPTPTKRNPKDREGSNASKKSSKDRESSISSTVTLRSKQEEPSPRVISLVENENDSFLTETTYI
ncbi:hypothetical protein KPH14_011258 [Odynerus spinipes]|uniref:Mab-21-like HhH/H2TH-like domain-containing protein n=1 Tax=Odynerus spinipes TaxID=1348599 RepID=A0AAD9VI59_9HYME|nr:hypothetical protein KPH14_011258 [Odynerus spinipes]